jgi:hypothetical protein
MKSNKFNKAKVCCIPGFFYNNVHVVVDENVPDEILKKYTLSLAGGGNFDTGKLTISVCKMKIVSFEAMKVTIPEEFTSEIKNRA